MPNLPVRGLAQYGVISDAAGHSSPPNSWTLALNARFVDGKVKRAPAFRTLLSSLSTTAPHFFAAVSPTSAPDYLVYTSLSGDVYRRTTTGLDTEITASAHDDTDSKHAFTATTLGENLILNRDTEQPWFIEPAGTQLVPMPGWDETHTAVSVRAYKDFLIALNVTKSGIPFPNLVKTSDAAEAGEMPESWDHTDEERLATENPLNELTTALVDGAVLGDDFMLYSSDQIWRMSYRADEFLFDYRQTPVTGGVINQNCIARANSLHYVFGVNDLYAHDGITKQSISDKRVRKFVFGLLDKSKVDRCFVFHDERLNTIRFCFPSNYSGAYWSNPTQCNLAASYNYIDDTWSIDDLPNVCGCALANPSTVTSYAAASGTYATTSASYLTVSESTVLVPVLATAVLAGSPAVSAKAYVHDLINDDEALLPSLTLDSAITPPVVMQKTMADLNDLGLTLKHYKEVLTVAPQIDADASFQVRAGGQMRVTDPISWDPYLTFDPSTDDQVDFKHPTTELFPGGRLVSIEFKFTSLTLDFEFTAYDADITAVSRG